MKRVSIVVLVLVLVLGSAGAQQKTIKSFKDSKSMQSTPDTKYVIVSPVRDKFLVNLFIDRGSGGFYRDGESIEISVKSNADCYIYLYSIDFQDNIHLIYPTYHHQNNQIEAEVLTELKPRSGRRFQVGGSGMQILYLVASTQPLHLFKQSDKLTYHSNQKFNSESEYKRHHALPDDLNTHEKFFYGINRRLSHKPKNTWSTATEIFFIPTGDSGQNNVVEVSSAPSGRVIIDNIDFGSTPVLITDVPEGDHRLIVKTSEQSYKRDFSISGNNKYFFFEFREEGYNEPEETVHNYYKPPQYPVYDDSHETDSHYGYHDPKQRFLVKETFHMTDGRQKFEREINEKQTLIINSVWTLNPDISQVQAKVSRRGSSSEKIFSLNFFMNEIPYKGQKFIKTVDGIKYTITVNDFKWMNNDSDSGIMSSIVLGILVEDTNK